jgi:polyhydroxyalkanoate synthase
VAPTKEDVMNDSPSGSNATDIFGQILKLQTDALKTMGQAMLRPMTAGTPVAAGDPADWTKVGERLQKLWTDFQQGQMGGAAVAAPGAAQWLTLIGSWGNAQKKMWEDGTALWKTLLGASGEAPEMPREDRRFADPRWRDQPLYAVLHQTYLMLAEQMLGAVDKLPGIDPVKQEHLRFAVRTLTEALSPDHFPLTNPLVIDRAIETKGESLVQGMQHLITDLQRGQLTHTDPDAFKLGENIAVTPGKVRRGSTGSISSTSTPRKASSAGRRNRASPCSSPRGNPPTPAPPTWCGTTISAPRWRPSTWSARG